MFPDSVFNNYTLENVYLNTSEQQRNEIIALWQKQAIITDAKERSRRSHEVVLMVRNAAGKLAGISSVGLQTVAGNRIFYNYRMFIQPGDRIPYLMRAVTKRSCDILRAFQHPTGFVAGVLILTENPKLMRAGIKRELQRIGFSYDRKSSRGLDIWIIEFNPSLQSIA